MLSISLLLLISCFTITILSTSLLYPSSIAIAQQPTYPDVDSPTNNQPTYPDVDSSTSGNVDPDAAIVGPSIDSSHIGPRPIGPSIDPFKIPSAEPPASSPPTEAPPASQQPSTLDPSTDLGNSGSGTSNKPPDIVTISDVIPWIVVAVIAVIVMIALSKTISGRKKIRKLDIPTAAHVDIKTKGGIKSVNIKYW
jgi:hypothetical protein